ncbi:MAG: hypothetical protein WBV42_02645 [Haladaptatus sp.]
MTVVASVFAVGFAGNAAAYGHHHKKMAGDTQYSSQHAWSGVSQGQYVAQGNANHQDTNVAISAALGRDAESDDATAIQASYQSNDNSQAAWSQAGNWNEQEN